MPQWASMAKKYKAVAFIKTVPLLGTFIFEKCPDIFLKMLLFGTITYSGMIPDSALLWAQWSVVSGLKVLKV